MLKIKPPLVRSLLLIHIRVESMTSPIVITEGKSACAKNLL